MTRAIVLTTLSVALLTSAARAQYAPPAPLYPYVAQPGQTYAVEVAPGRYVIHRPRNYPYAHCENGCDDRAPATARKIVRRSTHNDPALINELRRRHTKATARDTVHTTRIVHDKPVVVEHQRVVDDPPRVIERRHYVEDSPPASRQHAVEVETDIAPSREAVKAKPGKRVIRAEAEVTIYGPDRMSIRLFRKRAGGAEAKAATE